MNISTISRQAVRDIRQHMAVNFLTTMIVTLNILIFLFFSLIYWNLHAFVSRFGSELGLVIYLKKGVEEARIPAIYKDIARMKGVEQVNYISPEEAFRRLETYLGEEKGVLEGVDPTFLPPSFEVRVEKAIFQPQTLGKLSKNLKAIPGVSKVQYGKDWVQRLEVFANVVKKVVFSSGLLLLFTAAFVVSSTIRLNVYSRQAEIEILRLVGATNSFIQGPFILEAMIQGLLGSTLAILLLFIVSMKLTLMSSSGDILRTITLTFLPANFMIGVVFASILFCVLGTHLSMRRFLRR